LITTGSLFFGLAAIFYTFEQTVYSNSDPFRWACYYILIAAVLDALDGKIARLTNSESEFGVYFDSLSDAIVFGVAPSMLMYSHLRTGDNARLAELACIVYTICGVLRLARFNCQASGEERSSFTGLPIPAAAAMVVSAYLVATINEVPWALAYTPYLLILLALLMVSRFPYGSLKGIDIDTSRSFEVLVLTVIVVSTIVAYAAYKEWVIAIIAALYVASGPIYALREWLTRPQPGPVETIVTKNSSSSTSDDVQEIG
jgi:CDP-diacylglycerol--serine O-phosphatidyltransferase